MHYFDGRFRHRQNHRRSGAGPGAGRKFIDGDDLHPRQNIVKMAASQPLDDDDRQPWLERIADVIFSLEQKNESGVLVCSALKNAIATACVKAAVICVFCG
jgi:carbohydrate kinase (thermoresistant glucokinase family)